MPAIYQGDKKIVDRYVGEKLITRAYQGNKLIFDAYSELSGTLPLTVRSRASQILKNYRIYGASGGVGDKTVNLFDGVIGIDNTIISTAVGDTKTNVQYALSTPISVEGNKDYTFVYTYKGDTAQRSFYPGYFLNGNMQKIGIVLPLLYPTVGTNSCTLTAPANASFFRLQWKKEKDTDIMFVEGSTAPSSYIPHGYKLPLTVESRETENLFAPEDVSFTISNVNFVFENGQITVIGTSTANISSVNAKFKSNAFRLTAGTYYYKAFSRPASISLALYEIDGTATEAIVSVSDELEKSFVLEQDADVFWGAYIPANTTINGTVLISITPGSTSPDHYIPHRYTSDIPIYIGSSKLYEEEYVDYGEQKIYKRGENEFPFAEEGTFTFGNGSVISDGSGTFIINTENNDTNVPSELIPLTTPYTVPQTNGEYTFYLGGNDVNPALLIVFYDSERNLVDDWMYNSTWRKESDIPLMAGRTITYIGFRINTNYGGSANMSVTPMISKNNNLTAYVPYIQPTDPPVPLPDITIPKGEVTVDTEEEFKYHSTIKGRINPVHYAYRINADTAEITYLADNKNFTPAAMGATTFDYGSWGNAFFMPRPCMLKSNGKVDYYLDPNDYSKKLDGTASDIADPTYDGNVMLEFPKIWYKFEPTGDDGEGGTFHCSNVKLDDDYECWCNYDAENNEIDHFYVAAYNAVILDNKMRSLSGYALTQENGADTTTGATEIAAARANNQNGIDEWYTYLISDHQLLTYLATLMCKHVNHQAKFGRGLDTGSTAAKRAYVTGTLNDKGLFWGDISTGTQGVKIFGIENFYVCVWKRAAGLIGTSTGYSYKLTHGTKDGSTATSFNTNGSGYKTIARTKPANGYVTTMHYESNGFWIPATTGTNRYNDYHYTGNGYASVGGTSGGGSYCGSWCVALHHGVSHSGWGISSALSCKPKA